MLREVHDIRPGPAAQVERASRRMRRDEALELRWSETRVPPTAAGQPIPDAEEEPPHEREPRPSSFPLRELVERSDGDRANLAHHAHALAGGCPLQAL